MLGPGSPALVHLHQCTAQEYQKSDRIQNSKHPNPSNFAHAVVVHQPLWFGFPLWDCLALIGEPPSWGVELQYRSRHPDFRVQL